VWLLPFFLKWCYFHAQGAMKYKKGFVLLCKTKGRALSLIKHYQTEKMGKTGISAQKS